MKYTVANSDRICNVAFVQQLCVSKYNDSDIQLMKIVLWCLCVLITVEPIKSVLLRPHISFLSPSALLFCSHTSVLNSL